MMCPCHQSIFDVADDGESDFRAGRSRAAAASDGDRYRTAYLRATGDFPFLSVRDSGSARDTEIR